MADKKISQLTAASTPLDGTEVVPIVKSGSTVKVAVSDLTAGRAVTALSATLTGGVVNGVLYLNAGKVATSGSALQFDGTNLGIGAAPAAKLHVDGGSFVNSASTVPALGASIVAGEIHAGESNLAAADSGYLRLSAGGGTTAGVKAAIDILRDSGGASEVRIYTSGTERMRVDLNGNARVGTAALTTTATNGFLYVPTCAGVPTGTPTAITGLAPIVVDTTNNRWYFYSGGAWRNAGP
jgi:hypothetical protein